MRFKVILTEQGKQIFKGENVEVMRSCLISFESKNLATAESFFYNKYLLIAGTSQKPYYRVVNDDS